MYISSMAVYDQMVDLRFARHLEQPGQHCEQLGLWVST